MSLRISVVIPTADRSDWLQECLESVQKQSLAPWETIVVDNGNSDCSAGIEKHFDIKYIRSFKRVGVSQARNIGASVASGEFVAFLDDDDSWDCDYLASVASQLDGSGADIVVGCLYNRASRLPIIDKCGIFPSSEVLARSILTRNPGVGGSNLTVRKSILMSSRGFDPSLRSGEDRALVLELLNNGASAIRCVKAIAYIRVNHSSIRQTGGFNLTYGKLQFLRKYWSSMAPVQRVRNLEAVVASVALAFTRRRSQVRKQPRKGFAE